MSIKVNHISYNYNKKNKALDDVSFEITDGSFTAIIGHTGSGKSTLVQLFNRLLKVQDGFIDIDDYHITNKKIKNLKQLRQKVGLVFQFPEYQLFEETVLKDVMFGPLNFGVKNEEAKEKAMKYLSLVGIPESYYEKSPFELSGGERRRVAIAGILAIEPEILVLDEPTAGLDAQGSKDILNLLAAMNENGKTIVVITHNMDFVLSHATQVLVLKDGQLAFDGTPYDLFKTDYQDLAIDCPYLLNYVYALEEKGLIIDHLKLSEEKVISAIKEWRKDE